MLDLRHARLPAGSVLTTPGARPGPNQNGIHATACLDILAPTRGITEENGYLTSNLELANLAVLLKRSNLFTFPYSRSDMAQVIIITGAGSGFGKLTAETLASLGHVVYAGLRSQRDLDNSNASGHGNAGNLRHVVLDITNDSSVKAAVDTVISEAGRLDTVIHNAGHMGMGPAESFSAEQMHDYYEINAVGAHRLNQAVLPIMRKARRGHIIWVSSSSARGGSGPLLAPYFAAKAAMHSLAYSLWTEVACWGIETTIVVPGIFTSGTNHFANAGKPAFPDIAAEYMDGPLKGADSVMMERVNETFPKDASVQLVADAIANAVDAPRGSKPFRIPVDPFQDGSDEVMSLADKSAVEFLKRCGIDEICALRTS